MWHFRRKGKGEKIRDPIQGEFFATEAIGNPAQALIRESIQNSLDAEAEALVRARIFLPDEEGFAPWNHVADYFVPAWPHFHAPKNGLRETPSDGESCRYLVFEDFGTTGLIGDETQSDLLSGDKNPFFMFFRAEGRSDKGETERGRWGVGKFVFPRSSRLSTHFGLTVRKSDGRTLLLGAATLKSHVVDNCTYAPDGLFGTVVEEDFVLPIEKPEAIQKFCRDFRLSRTREPGLSVVVPFVDPEITFDRLVSAAAKEYFLPILAGALAIRLESSRQCIDLESATIQSVLEKLDAEQAGTIGRYVDLAKWRMSLVADELITVATGGASGNAPRWSADMISADTLTTIRSNLKDHKRIAIRVPMYVRPKDGPAAQSYFEILLVADRQSDGRPLFSREGIVVSDIKAPRAREIRSLVIVEDKPLATMLGDSENPAHTQWQKDSSNFKGKYKFGPGSLDFVTSAVAELLKIVNADENRQDPSLTVDFFSLPSDISEDTEKGLDSVRAKAKPDDVDEEELEIHGKPAKVKIRRQKGGFVVTAGNGAPEPPFRLKIEAAYDVRNGNPLRLYHPADFNLTSTQFKVSEDAERFNILIKQANQIVADVFRKDYSIGVTGFDEDRDVYVRANVESEREHVDVGTQS